MENKRKQMIKKTPSPRIRQIFAGIMLVLLGCFSISFSYQYDVVIPHFVFLDVVGILLLVVGVVFRILAFKELHWTHQIKNLVTSGIYSKIRNPVYLAFALIIFGITFLSVSLLTFIWILLSFIIFYWLAKKEEIDLEKAFGQDYIKYKQKVPMFFPKIWKTSVSQKNTSKKV